ncbi:MAG: acetylornithine deacetylase [Candidatus Buchananbacteria bacterium]|nr:acetylornithine deacetylase [Candidatus Buchananbacteria bacterium]
MELMMEIFRRLVGFNTVSANSNRAAADFLCEVLRESLKLSESAIYVTSQDSTEGQEKCNVVATIGAGDGGLMLAGHIDTVSAEPLARWDSNPFELTLKHDKYYGLGTCDMKFFLAAAIAAARNFSSSTLRRPLVLAFTHDEETSMAGAKRLRRDDVFKSVHYAVVGEPTKLVPVRMHKGWLGAEFTLHGKAGHASDPGCGTSAIELASELLSQLYRYRDELTDFRQPLLRPEYPTLNVGLIKGGEGVNRIPASCKLELEIRPIPGQDVQDLIGDLQRIADNMTNGNSHCLASLRVTSAPTQPMETSEQSRIVHVAQAVTGQSAIGVPFATEAAIYNAAGLETIVLGPGDIAQAHQPNEFIAAEYLDRTVTVLSTIIEELCVKGGD